MAEGGGTQIIQQIESLLAQLAQQEPDPGVQRAIQEIQKPMEALQQVVGGMDAEDMSSGLNNPGGAPPPTNAAGLESGGGPAMAPGEGDTSASGGKEEHPALVIHIGSGGPKSFGEARKAAMATHAEKGHFNPHGEKGEEQETQRSRNRKGAKA